jgi:DNA-binding PadR family transcriptional regulator
MYRDNTLIPTEAIRLLALGILAQRSERYADIVGQVRHFTSRIVGPSLDLMGTSLELLRYEGLIEPVDGQGMQDNARMRITEAGRAEFRELMRSGLRAPSNDMGKLVVALKMRFLHLLEPAEQRSQIELLIDGYEAELARLQDLREHHADDAGHLVAWLDHDIGHAGSRLAWLRRFHDSL